MISATIAACLRAIIFLARAYFVWTYDQIKPFPSLSNRFSYAITVSSVAGNEYRYTISDKRYNVNDYCTLANVLRYFII